MGVESRSEVVRMSEAERPPYSELNAAGSMFDRAMDAYAGAGGILTEKGFYRGDYSRLNPIEIVNPVSVDRPWQPMRVKILPKLQKIYAIDTIYGGTGTIYDGESTKLIRGEDVIAVADAMQFLAFIGNGMGGRFDPHNFASLFRRMLVAGQYADGSYNYDEIQIGMKIESQREKFQWPHLNLVLRLPPTPNHSEGARLALPLYVADAYKPEDRPNSMNGLTLSHGAYEAIYKELGCNAEVTCVADSGVSEPNLPEVAIIIEDLFPPRSTSTTAHYTQT